MRQYLLRGFVFLVVGLACGVIAISRAQETGKSDRAPTGAADAKLRQFMRHKLKHAHDALDGLCTEDLDLVASAAAKMVDMSRASDWVVIQGPVYAQHSAEFREACAQLEKVAKEENSDGASLAYLRVTMSCMSCHKFVRLVRIAAHLPPDGVPVALDRRE